MDQYSCAPGGSKEGIGMEFVEYNILTKESNLNIYCCQTRRYFKQFWVKRIMEKSNIHELKQRLNLPTLEIPENVYINTLQNFHKIEEKCLY
jgi:hypothetical protein